VHKFGYALKGASTIIYRNAELRKNQFYVYSAWPGGFFASPSFLGTRPGGSIAAAWAAVVALGEDGYVEITRNVMQLSKELQREIATIPGLSIMGNPPGTVFAFTSSEVNIVAVGDVMNKEFGWRIEVQQLPPSIHCTLNHAHLKIRDQFLRDLRQAVEIVRANPEVVREGMAGAYGMVANIPDPGIVDDFIASYVDKVYSPRQEN
jgi:sphinganine-1-phosphate aldolase